MMVPGVWGGAAVVVVAAEAEQKVMCKGESVAWIEFPNNLGVGVPCPQVVYKL